MRQSFYDIVSGLLTALWGKGGIGLINPLGEYAL